MAPERRKRREPRVSQQILITLAPSDATNEQRERSAAESAAILRGGHVQLKRPRAGLR